jgi:hypothetical protein
MLAVKRVNLSTDYVLFYHLVNKAISEVITSKTEREIVNALRCSKCMVRDTWLGE